MPRSGKQWLQPLACWLSSNLSSLVYSSPVSSTTDRQKVIPVSKSHVLLLLVPLSQMSTHAGLPSVASRFPMSWTHTPAWPPAKLLDGGRAGGCPVSAQAPCYAPCFHPGTHTVPHAWRLQALGVSFSREWAAHVPQTWLLGGGGSVASWSAWGLGWANPLASPVCSCPWALSLRLLTFALEESLCWVSAIFVPSPMCCLLGLYLFISFSPS